MIIKTRKQVELEAKLCACSDICDTTQYFEKLQNLGRELKSNEAFLNLSNFGLALSSVERIIILDALKERDRCVCELEAILDKSQSTISHHLRKLERANLIKSYKKGNYNYYGLKKDQFASNLEVLNKMFTLVIST